MTRRLLALDLLLIGVSLTAIFLVSSVSGAAPPPKPVPHDGGAFRGQIAPHRLADVTRGTGLGSRGAEPTVPAGAQALVKLFTERSRTYKPVDGPYVTILYSYPVNEQALNGEWHPLGSLPASARKPVGPHIDASLKEGVTKDCPLASNSPTTSLCSATTDTVGYDGTNTDNSLVQFKVKEALPIDSSVLNAQLGMYLFSASTTNPVSVSAYAAAKPWTTAATWNTYDGTNAWTTPGGDVNSKVSPVANPSVTGPAAWVRWYPTQIVQGWENGTIPNEGLLLADTTQKQTNDMLSFYSSKSTNTNKPYLTISWVHRGQEDQPFYSMQSLPITDRATMKVNLASGDLFVNSNDLSVKGTGVPFLAEHNYDSRNTEGGSVNPWYSISSLAPYEDGSVAIGINRYDYEAFIRQSNGSYVTPPGIDATFCEINGTTCTKNSVDGTNAKWALTFSKGGNGPLYAQGNKITFEANGRTMSDADRYGNAVVYHWSEHGLTSVTDTQGRTFTRNLTTIPGGFYVTSSWVDSAGGREVKYAYNSEGRLESYTDAAGKVTKYTYNAEHSLKEIIDPEGFVTTIGYDTHYRVTELTLREVNKERPTWKYEYVEGPGTKCNTEEVKEAVKYTVVTDPNGHKSTFCANALDEMLHSFDAEGNPSASTFNPIGNLLSATAASPGTGESGNVTSLNYDEKGTLNPGSNVECAITSFTKLQPKCEANKEYLQTNFEYKDKKNEFLLTEAKDPQGNKALACYNGGEQSENKACVGASGPKGSLQNVTDQLPAGENEVKFAYNENNGTVKSSTDADGHTTSYEYDEKGNLKVIKPAAPLGETTIGVDTLSRPHEVKDGAGHVTTVTYDRLDRVTEIVYTGTGAAKTVKFEYDPNGDFIKLEDSTGTTKYAHDQLGRLTKEELPGSLSNEYGYDLASNLTTLTDAGGTTKYKYNATNEVETLTEPTEKVTTFAYDGDHRLKEIHYASGAREKYKLEPTSGRPETITFEGLSGISVPNLTYTYKKGENNTSLVQTVKEATVISTTITYAYDPVNRLTEAIATGANTSKYVFELDGAGNRKKQQVYPGTGNEETTFYAYNAANELECRQSVAPPCSGSASTERSHYEYDGAGELKAIVPKLDKTGSTFGYNAASQTSAITPSGGSEQALAYAGTGQDDLVTLGVTSLQNSTLGLTKEVGSGGTSYFARTPDGLLIDQRTPSGNFNPLYDAQGDIIALVSSAAKVERTFRYGPYGDNTKSEGTQTIPFPFGYKGGFRMPGGNKGATSVANGLYHSGERYYDPTTGRWTQQDPESGIAIATQGNRFLFASSDPINASDPTGLKALQANSTMSYEEVYPAEHYCHGEGEENELYCSAIKYQAEFGGGSEVAENSSAGEAFGHDPYKDELHP
jgi:RHS repeat-associated protein